MWILILVAFGSNGYTGGAGTAISQAGPFHSMAACVRAGRTIERQSTERHVRWSCVKDR